MSLIKKVSISTAFVVVALLLVNGIDSRTTLETAPLKQATAQSASDKSEQASTVDGISASAGIQNANKSLSANAVKLLLESKLPGIQVIDIEQSPLEGFYQAFLGGELIYVSNNGQFIFTGNMLELAEGSPINHTQIAMTMQDNKQAPFRAQTLAQVDESEMVIFKAKQEKHVITVFTDVDCAYCRKLHKEMPHFNDNGITVRYMAFPRAGVGSDAYQKLVSVWCANNKQAAMDDAKLRRQFGQFGPTSCKNPVAKQFDMTQQFNLSGTPMIILSDGELLSGYVPASDLITYLSSKSLNSEKAAMVSVPKQ